MPCMVLADEDANPSPCQAEVAANETHPRCSDTTSELCKTIVATMVAAEGEDGDEELLAFHVSCQPPMTVAPEDSAATAVFAAVWLALQ